MKPVQAMSQPFADQATPTTERNTVNTSVRMPESVETSEPFTLNPGVTTAVGTPLPRLAYSMRETAEILGISYISVYRLVQRGLLKSSSALRHKLIPLTEIQRLLKGDAI